MKKLIIAFFVIITGLLVTACGNNSDESDEGNETLRVAIALTGSKTDGGWNQSAYNGIVKIEEELGAEIAYNENTQASDYERILRDYAKDGNDVVIGHGAQFSDAALIVGEEYPDTIFIVTSSTVTNDENVGSLNNNYLQAGFLKGAFAALMSESGTVGAVGGAEIPPIANDLKGFEAGAKYINPDSTVLLAFTGSGDDSNKAKETALAFISQGADIIEANANQAGRGVYTATEENGLYALASIAAEYDKYPETLIACAPADMAQAIFNTVEQIQNGEYEVAFHEVGVAEGIIGFTYNPSLESNVPSDVIEKMDEILEGMDDGSLDVTDYVTAE